MSADFQQMAMREFRFLITEYQCRLVGKKSANYGYELTYCNATTGVRITYEFREGYVFVVLYRLIDGVLVENPWHIDNSSQVTGFCLDDILRLRAPHEVMKPVYEYGQDSEFHKKRGGLARYVHRFAENLRNHAQDILRGEFALWGRLEELVKKRLIEFRKSDEELHSGDT